MNSISVQDLVCVTKLYIAIQGAATLVLSTCFYTIIIGRICCLVMHCTYMYSDQILFL
jgi:hypothetical protein